MRIKGKLCAGQELVVTRWIGMEGSCILAREKKEILLSKLPSEMVGVAEAFSAVIRNVEKDVETAVRLGALALWEAEQDGIFGALWDMAEWSGVGIRVEFDRIPIRQETIEICEALDLDPYTLSSRGALLLGTDGGFRLAAELNDAGVDSAVIGYVTEERERVILHKERKRFLTPGTKRNGD